MKGISNRHYRGDGKKGNVMTPLNWMAGVSEAIFITGSVFTNSELSEKCFWFAVAIGVFYAAAYTYFAIRDPNRLQTEAFNLASQEMKILISNTPSDGQLVKIEGKNDNFIDINKT